MTSDEHIMKKPDERIATTPGPIDDVRGHHEEHIVDQPGAATVQPPASAVRTDTNVEQTRSVRSQKEGRTGGALFEEGEVSRLRNRWIDIQNSFVDEPRRAVKEADGLVVDLTKRLTEMFAAERAALERQWDRNNEVTTEDLRIALKGYHAFFDRLLAVS
jgi:hypothetical protein